MNQILGIDTTLDEMYLTGATKNRTLYFIEEFTRESVYKAIYLMNRIERLDDLENLPEEKRVINFVFASYGGCAYSCLALIGEIERLKEKGYIVNSHIMSFAMSAGFFTSIACSNRTINRHAYLMAHQMSGGEIGTIQSMKEGMEHSEDLWGKMKDITLRYTDITEEEIENMRSTKLDWYMNSELALALNCVDKIV